MAILSKINNERKAFEELRGVKVSFIFIPITALIVISGYYFNKIYTNVQQIPKIQQNVTTLDSIVKIDHNKETLTKEDIKDFARKEDLTKIATKEDLQKSFDKTIGVIQYTVKHNNKQTKEAILEYLEQQKQNDWYDFSFSNLDTLKPIYSF